MSDVVPLEVQMEIVKRVDDVSSVIRFRSVSKEWKSFIDSSEFIVGYGFRRTQPSRFMFRYLHYQEDHKEDDVLDEFGNIRRIGPIWFSEIEKCICFVDNDEGFALQHDFPPFVVVPDLIQRLKREKTVLGMSCGLFCIHGNINSERGDIVVWNPSIRKSINIDIPHVSEWNDNTVFGFGVCPVTCDPTITRISDLAHNIRWQAEIFTLSSKRWNLIPSSNLPRKSLRLRSHHQVVTDRFIYWVTIDFEAEHNGLRNHSIMSFDLITNEFKEIIFPESLINEAYAFLTISKLREILAVSAHINLVTKQVCGVWMMVMEDNGNVATFQKMFNFDMIDTSVNRILGFMKRGEPVLDSYQKREDSDLTVLEVYEPWSDHKTNLGIYGVDGSFFMDSYEETLLLLDHSNGFVYSDMM